MIPSKVRAVCALGALALVHVSMAIDLNLTDNKPLQCATGESCSILDSSNQHKSISSETIHGIGRDELAANQQQLFQHLTGNQAPVQKAGFTVQLTQQDLVDIGEAPGANGQILRADPRRVQVGVEKKVGMDLSFSSLYQKRLTGGEHMGGAVMEGLDGEFVWTAQAHSKGARALRIAIEEFDLPAGAQLFAYNDRGEAFGPYAGRGPGGDGYFWTNTIMGDTVTLQLHFQGPRSRAMLDQLGFRIDAISHIGSRFPLADFVGGENDGEKAYCSYNESCVEPGQNFQGAENAVALILFNSGGGSYICSGGLLADSDAGSVIPYFLTANHCLSKGREAKSVEAIFDFDTSCANRYGDNGSYHRTNGSSIKSTSRTSDYTLLQLDQTPGGLPRVYLGWNNQPVANSNGTSLYRISHPSGAPQAYSEHSVNTSKGTCTSWPRGNWIYSEDIYGATEGGSSGSPVLNSAGQVVGQLSGGCGTNVGDTCDTTSNATVDGALAAYFSAVAPFLDPSDDPGPGGECTLLPLGASCNSNSECCSNKCKGSPNNKTCK